MTLLVIFHVLLLRRTGTLSSHVASLHCMLIIERANVFLDVRKVLAGVLNQALGKQGTFLHQFAFLICDGVLRV